MVEHKIARSMHKHGRFLTLGLTVALGYVGAHTIGFGQATTIPYLGGASELAGSALLLLTGLSTLFGLLSMSERGLVGVGALGYIKSSHSLLGEKIYKKYKNTEVLSSSDVVEKELFMSFFKVVGDATLFDTTKTVNNVIKIGILNQEHLNNPLIKKAYLEYVAEKNQNVLGKIFIDALSNNFTELIKDPYGISNFVRQEELATNLFKDLLTLNHELTASDQKYITHQLSRLKDNSIKNNHLIDFMQSRENFSLLNEENKKLFLNVSGNKLKNRDELIEVVNKQNIKKDISSTNEDSEQSIQNLEHKPTVINELSYQNFSKFKANFQSIYQNIEIKDTESTLSKIETVLFLKEQIEEMLPFTAEKDMVNLKMFLNQDIDKIVNSFNREINILHKMKIMKHPELDEKKSFIFKNINERIDIITDKIGQYQKIIHDSLSDELDAEYEVNKKVLSAKM